MDEVTFLGDVFLPKPYTSQLDIGDFVCNLEYPITATADGWPGKVNLKSETNYLKETFGRAPIAVCLANNHIMDYGVKGLEETFASLDATGIKYFGAGSISNNCHNPLIIECGDYSIGLMGYVCESTSPVYANTERPGVHNIDPSHIEDDIETAREEGAEYVVVYLHWGAEEVYLPKPADIKIARRLADAGADLILGQHAHRIQPFETYNDCVIFYGLGNCIMPDLQLSAYYENGSPTQQFNKIQRSWNRKSLGIRFDKSDTSTFRTLFTDEVLSQTHTNADRYRFRMNNVYEFDTALYSRIYKLSYIYTKMKTLASNFVDNPKRITLDDLKTVINIVKTEEYD